MCNLLFIPPLAPSLSGTLWLRWLLFGLCVVSPAVCQLLDEPLVRGNFSLSGSTMRRGNGMVMPDDNRVILTTYEGNLHIIRTNFLENSSSLVYTPDIVHIDRVIICRSSVALLETYNQSLLAVYAVIDSQTNINTSRVLGVRVEDSSLQWSVTIPGAVVGTPMISQKDNRTIFVVHNIFDERTQEEEGRISVISLSQQESTSQENSTTTAKVIGTLPNAQSTTGAPFGPGTLHSIIDRPQGGLTRDIVFVAERRRNGRSSRGALHALVEVPLTSAASSTIDDSNLTFPYEFIMASDFPGSAETAPVVSRELDLYLGTQGSNILGFTDRNSFNSLPDVSTTNNDDDNTDTSRPILSWDGSNASPSWILELTVSSADNSDPIPATPILSPDENFLFAVAAGNQVVCIRTNQNGASSEFVWSFTTDGPHFTQPIYQTYDNSTSVVYFIERLTGTIRQLNADDGTLNWDAITNVEVQADAVLSPNGGTLYVGDINGLVIALNVALFETVAPTSTPSQVQTLSPSYADTRALYSLQPSTKTLLDAPTKVPLLSPSSFYPSISSLYTPTTLPSTTPSLQSISPESTDIYGGSSGENKDGISSSAVKEPDQKDSDWLGLPFYLGVACATVALMTLLTVLIVRRKRKKVCKESDDTKRNGDSHQDQAEVEKLYEIQKKQLELEIQQDELEMMEALGTLSKRQKKTYSNRVTDSPLTAELTEGSPTNSMETVQATFPNILKENDTHTSTVLGFNVTHDDNSISASYANDSMSDPLAVRSVSNNKANRDSRSDIPNEITRLDALVRQASQSSSHLHQQNNRMMVSPTPLPSIAVPPSMAETTTSSGIRNSYLHSTYNESPMQLGISLGVSLSMTSDEDMEAYSNFMEDDASLPTKMLKENSKPQVPQFDHSSVSHEQTFSQRIPSPQFQQFGLEQEYQALPPTQVTKSNPSDRPPSPSAQSDMFSLDESLYVDESTIAEADVGAGSRSEISEPQPTINKHKLCPPPEGFDPEEPPAILKPGAHYLERHSTTKPESDPLDSDGQNSFPTLNPNKLKPTYKGVSVRPSRSKAGIFSRRMIPIRPNSDDDSSTVIPDLDLPHPTESSVSSKPTVLVKKHRILQIPNNDIPLVEPTPPTYFTEDNQCRKTRESSKSRSIHKNQQHVSRDVPPTQQIQQKEPKTAWSILLQELSAAENQFFNPLSPSKSPDEAELQATRPSRSLTQSAVPDGDSDSSGRDTPPPPRTFFA